MQQSSLPSSEASLYPPSWSNDAGQVFAIANNSRDKASLAVSVLLPRGASLTAARSPAPAPALSSDVASETRSNGWIIMLAGTALVVGGVLLWRMRTRA